ncbi:MAG: 50S ribosome-binding GTPase [Alphaproteobacteria bacterium]|nr:50S ribosome-binding GTPase [Alphaproteobacteria bacterium]
MAGKQSKSSSSYLRGVMVALAMLLPVLSLAAFGTFWLWQNNALIIWSVAAATVALLIYTAEVWLISSKESELEKIVESVEKEEGDEPGGAASFRAPREDDAWQAVERLAMTVQPDKLTSRDAIFELGTRTVETVARRMHPDEKDALWKFTVPEALTLVSRVSKELNHFVIDAVPLGDRLTIGQLMAVYRWRSLATVAQKAYDLWRILRFVNPATAIAGELREKVSSELLEGMRTELTRRLARAYVREVGKAAIDLYSGRLRPDLRTNLERDESEATEPLPAAPLQILVIGQSGVGKSSLVNALSNEVRAAVDVVPTTDTFTTHALSRGDVPLTYLIESPAIGADDERTGEVVAKAAASDAVIWIISATRPDRAADVATLKLLRDSLSIRIDRRPPPVLFLLSNVDRLRPFNAWTPPYDLNDATDLKSRSINEALAAVSEDINVPADEIIPVAVPSDREPYNVDLVWARLMDLFEDARNVQLLRRLSDGVRTPITKSLWRQAIGAGRVIRKAVFNEPGAGRG